MAPAQTEKQATTQTTQQTAPAPPAKKEAAPEPFYYEDDGRRDPFNPLVLSREEIARREEHERLAAEQATLQKEEQARFLPPLQRFDLSNLELVGIIRGQLGSLAVVQGPDKRGYFVRKQTRLGRNGGKVIAIEADRIVIVEQFKNPLGKIENKEVVVKLRKEG